MTPIRILELRSVRGTGGGPEKTILLGSARTDRSRFAITVCYIRDQRDQVFGIDQKAAGLAVDYIEVRERTSLDPRVLGELRRIVRDRQIDIVHAHDYKTDLIAWLLWKIEGVTPLSTAHGWTGHSARERRFYYPMDKRLLARFPLVIAVSEDIRQVLLRAGARPDGVRTVLNGIDHEAFSRDCARVASVRASLGLQDDDIVIGSVGRLEPQKRFDLLLDAVAGLRSGFPRLKLLIAGDGSLRESLRAQIERLCLTDCARLLGHRADVVELHHAFDIYAQSSDYEGTPNSVLEAMALQTPVVATDVGGTAQLIDAGRDGLIVPPDDRDALASAIAVVASDPAAAARRAASARRRVETDLSFATRMVRVEAIYEELLGRQDRSRRPSPLVLGA